MLLWKNVRIVFMHSHEFMIIIIKDGKTALMIAAEGGHTETVKALIAAGADVNVICKQVIQMPLINDVV